MTLRSHTVGCKELKLIATLDISWDFGDFILDFLFLDIKWAVTA